MTTDRKPVAELPPPGGAFLEQLDWATLTQLCWQSSAKRRRAAHLAAGSFGCSTRVVPYSSTQPLATQVHPRCVADGCFDVFHDLLAAAKEKFAIPGGARTTCPQDVVRYAAQTLVRMQSDDARRRRVHRGFAAKPGRSDGQAAHVIAAIRSEASDVTTARWLEILFRFLRDYAHTEGRRGATWPLDGLTGEKSRHDHRLRAIGSPEAREEIAADIRTVLATAERAVGATWVHAMIWHPLLAGVVPAPLAEQDRLASGGDLERQVLSAWAHREYLRHRSSGLSPTEAFLAAGRTVAGRSPEAPSPEVLAVLRELDGDLDLNGRAERPLRR